jgi:hypothetical protein
MRFIVSGFCAPDDVLSLEVFAPSHTASILLAHYTGKETRNRELLPTSLWTETVGVVPVQHALHDR